MAEKKKTWYGKDTEKPEKEVQEHTPGENGGAGSRILPPPLRGTSLPEGGFDLRTVGFPVLGGVGQKIIGKDEILEAAEILNEYKRGKANLETRIVEDELWWELRHWEAIGRNRKKDGTESTSPKPSSAWLFNAIQNKHADAMDNFPEPVVLPREQSDEESARTLTAVLPVVMEANDFEQVFSDNWWEKLKHGTAVYGTFWDSQKENGLGDVSLRRIDLLNLFWEPGITDIQASRNLFIVELQDTDLLEEQYPEYKGKLSGGVVDVKQYVYDDYVDTSKKSVVVDWYYKVRTASGKTLVHYCKFVGDCLLYASENEPEYRDRGYYDHGEYPVDLDVLFPEKGTPVGFGYVSLCRDPQMYIDSLFGNILESSMMATKRRYFASRNTNVNVEQYLDWNQPIVDVEGEIDDRRLKEIVSEPLGQIYVEVAQMKIEEMKDTASNRDVNSGGVGSGVTAAAAIAALQEAGNKASRDMINGSYRCAKEIYQKTLELMRQFYDVSRAFRVAMPNQMGYAFVSLSNRMLAAQPNGMDSAGETLFRKPVFDLKVKAQKKNPFSRVEQNERAKELFNMGFFSPDRAQEAMIALDMMEFEGIDKVREQVQQGMTLLNALKQMQQQNMMLQQQLGIVNGMMMGQTAPGNPGGGQQSAPDGGGGSPVSDGVMQAAAETRTAYGDRLAKRSIPNVEGG